MNPIHNVLVKLPWWTWLSAEQRRRCMATCTKLVKMGAGAEVYKDELHWWGKQARFNQWLDHQSTMREQWS